MLRAEFEALTDAHAEKEEDMASYLQRKLLGLALRHCVRLPAELFASKGKTPPAFAERQIAVCCDEFKNIIERTVPFEPTDMMLEKMNRDGRSTPDALVEVTGVYLRLVPRGQGTAGLNSPDSMHAMLLSSINQEAQAKQFVERNTRDGILVPPDEETAKRLLLHTVATQVEPLCLSGMVSLFGALGKPGAPIRSPGTLVRTLTTKIVELGHVCGVFEMHVCTLEALFPVEHSLAPFEEEHMRRCAIYCNHAFRGGARPIFCIDALKRPMEEQKERGGQQQQSEDDSFLLSALGIRLDCPKTLLGDALYLLRGANAPLVVLDLLTCVAAQHGCAVSLRDAFAACPSEINAWTWLFSFFQLDLSSFGGGIGGSGSNGTNATDNGEGVVGGTPGSIGTGGVTSSPSPSYSSNYDLYPPASSSAIIVGGIKKCTAKNCLYPRACCDVTQTGHLSCVAHFSMCPDFCGVSDDFKRCDSGPTKKAFTTEFIDSFVRFCCGEICCPTGYICCVAPEIVGHNGNKCAKKEICNQVRGVFVCFCNSVVFFIRVCILFFLSREKLLTR